jgi:hypothetical protein
MNLSHDFKQALEDYILLLNKNYPHKTVLELVGTRYGLNHFERSMLYRGIAPADKADARKARLVSHPAASGKNLHIDLFNGLFTVAAYLRGFPVYLSIDGILRDASESHGSSDWTVHLDKALDLTMVLLEKIQPLNTVFYLDNPIEHCRVVVETIHNHFKDSGPDHEIVIHDSPDHLLEKAVTGILASSDSTIIDRSPLPVLDLPRAVLEFHFEPKFIAIEKLI